MLLFALLLQAVDPPPGADVVVRAPLPASPQTPATIVVEPAAMLIATCDADGDGMVDRIELNDGLEKTFKASDTAKTGAMRYLAYSDWALRWLGDRAALPSPYEVDRNNDDQVTLAELQDHFSRLFARYDANNDKTISRAELLTFRTAPLGSSGPPGSLSRTPKDKPKQK
ncbi:EF-hand domain-containing protein [Sphingomonas sp. SUN019]|uniref:EF-hand domain-containing protein n=1 Tax=Sphingomonas sp. SUN019 TaxID=2937788 RepID=UPI00216426A8|nr:EF-hand domain-containing protein [Sphingomonas sp. SUN019]UVO51162.1 EF-hand domain-containing protein [Sphingomonas sp. SUN019]